MPRVYFASRFDHRDLLRLYQIDLRSIDFEDGTRWIHKEQAGGPLEGDREVVEANLEDVAACDVFIAFTEPISTGRTSGGRHVEFGVALALGKFCLVVGPRENDFYWPHYNADHRIIHVNDWEHALMVLAALVDTWKDEGPW